MIVVPYTRLHPVTARLLNRHAPGHERVRIDPADDEAYWRLLARLWREPGDLIVIEQDVGIRAGVVESLTACREPWCSFPYRVADRVQVCLGCTRFTAGLKTAQPDLLDAVAADATGNLPPRVWQRLDVRMFNHLQVRGYRPHQHPGPVEHYHRYPG